MEMPNENDYPKGFSHFCTNCGRFWTHEDCTVMVSQMRSQTYWCRECGEDYSLGGEPEYYQQADCQIDGYWEI